MHYVTARSLLSVAALLALSACLRYDASSTDAATVSRVESPAGLGSGEPHLSSGVDGVVLSWLEPEGEDHVLWTARLSEAGWSERLPVVRGSDFFVNWADFPSVVVEPDGTMWAHWLQNEADVRMAYGVRVSRSDDGGRSWSEPWTPHEDGTATEHGFVSLFPYGDGIGLAWLDGRAYAIGPDGGPPTREMSVRFRTLSAEGPTGPDAPVDTRTCDCCQTDVATTDAGPVLVYRDRSPDEVRDIYVTRLEENGWTEPTAVHDDGWVIGGCPVNGPAVAAAGSRVAVAWFTAPGDAPEVRLAFSDDAGDTFGAPIRVDGGDPAGRVDVLLEADGGVVVSWLERTGGDAAEVRLRRVGPDGAIGEPLTVTGSSAARASGFPRMARLPWEPGAIAMAWTDIAAEGGAQVRVAKVVLP